MHTWDLLLEPSYGTFGVLLEHVFIANKTLIVEQMYHKAWGALSIGYRTQDP